MANILLYKLQSYKEYIYITINKRTGLGPQPTHFQLGREIHTTYHIYKQKEIAIL